MPCLARLDRGSIISAVPYWRHGKWSGFTRNNWAVRGRLACSIGLLCGRGGSG